MTDPLDFDGLVEMGARVLAHNAGDDDMCWALYADDARAILTAVLPHVLAGPREELTAAKRELRIWLGAETHLPMVSTVMRAASHVVTALSRIVKLTEGLSREGETG